jgi:hypothetical protein
MCLNEPNSQTPDGSNVYVYSQVRGIIRGSDIAGKLPTKEATVKWFLVNDPTINGITATDADGFYDFVIQVSSLLFFSTIR